MCRANGKIKQCGQRILLFSCCFQTGSCQKDLETIPSEARLTSLQAKCPAVLIICPADKYRSYLKKQCPQALANPETKRLHVGPPFSLEVKTLFTFQSDRV